MNFRRFADGLQMDREKMSGPKLVGARPGRMLVRSVAGGRGVGTPGFRCAQTFLYEVASKMHKND